MRASGASVGRAPAVSPRGLKLAARNLWQGTVRLHRDIEATPWGRLLLGNAWPAYLFGWPLGARVVSVWETVRESEKAVAEQGLLYYQALLLQEVVTTLFLVVVVALFLFRKPPLGKRADWRGGVVALSGTLILNVSTLFPVPASTSTESLLLSSALVVAGTLFTIASLLALGRCFGVLPEVRGLVMRGPYRLVRHPVYLGEMISGLGVVVARPSLVTALLWVAFVLFQYWRTRFEEQALAEAFPREYPRYQQSTGRLIPRWR